MEALKTTKITIINIYQTCFNPKNRLSPKQKLHHIKGDLIALYLVAIRLYYIIYN
ncbi:hypothetical protein [Mucilaginibacter celer]|uniref:hypothetical protein n=1 Tax=Mucilaginibacter celer TaxID=2305508 RepID=UPI0013CE8230|nr:hypothetical protein [Mucilaginibacter celer]